MTGVQTCALPISQWLAIDAQGDECDVDDLDALINDLREWSLHGSALEAQRRNLLAGLSPLDGDGAQLHQDLVDKLRAYFDQQEQG